MAPLLTVRGRDRYVGGEAGIEMRLFSLVPVARDSGPGLNQGAMLRYLNEIMWFPAAAVSPYITWEPRDAGSAVATMRYQEVTASATFFIDAEGRLTDMRADRYNTDRGRLEPWSTPITAYGERNGIAVPVAGEGVWMYDTGDFSYIRLRVTEIEYNQPARY